MEEFQLQSCVRGHHIYKKYVDSVVGGSTFCGLVASRSMLRLTLAFAFSRSFWVRVDDSYVIFLGSVGPSFCLYTFGLHFAFVQRLNGCDSQCTVHAPALDWFCEQLSLCLHHCAVLTMPTVCQSSSVPGWNTAARLYKEKANFWHAVWKQAGSPTSGVLHQIKKSSRSRYKYEVRRLRRREEFIRREKMAAALASSNSKSFWQQVHRVNKSNKPPPASFVDGVSGSNHISLLFSSKLESLLNSQPSTGCDSLHSSLVSSLSADDLKAVSISEECVVDAFSHLKRGKSDGSTLMSDHLIHAQPAICSSLASCSLLFLDTVICLSLLGTVPLYPYPRAIKIPGYLTIIVPLLLLQL